MRPDMTKINPLCDILHPSPGREEMAGCGTGVYCMNPLPPSPLAPIKHWASPTSPHSLLSLQLLHHWFKCLTGACRTPTSLYCKLAWGDGSHCAHKTHKTQWKFQPWDNDPNFHEAIKHSKKLAGRVQDHAYLCRITCHLGREAERRMLKEEVSATAGLHSSVWKIQSYGGANNCSQRKWIPLFISKVRRQEDWQWSMRPWKAPIRMSSFSQSIHINEKQRKDCISAETKLNYHFNFWKILPHSLAMKKSKPQPLWQ